MRVYVNRSPVDGPWGGGAHFFRAMHEYSRHTIKHDRNGTLGDALIADVVLIAGFDPDANGVGAALVMNRPHMCSIVRVNDCDARKGTQGVDDAIRRVVLNTSGAVWVSNWLQAHLGCSRVGRVIVNGVEPNTRKEHPEGPLRIVTHHWSDNPLKGADIHERIDALCSLHPHLYQQTFIGRHKRKFKATRTVGPLYGQELRDELATHDVYVSASRFDPGPNHVLEALATGLPVLVHADGGGAIEFAGHDSMYLDWEDLHHRLVSRTFPTNVGHVSLTSWQESVRLYDDYIDEVYETHRDTRTQGFSR